MSDRISISKMALSDIDEVQEIENTCFSTPWSRLNLEFDLKSKYGKYYVARINEKIVGFIGMLHVVDEGHVTNVAVLPEFRRCGIAKLLIQTLIDYSKRKYINYIFLEVRRSNLPAILLYQSFGFAETGERRDYYVNPVENALLMTKTFRMEEENEDFGDRNVMR